MARFEDAKVVSVRLESEDQEWMKAYAENTDLSVSQIIRRALKYYKKEVIDKEEK